MKLKRVNQLTINETQPNLEDTQVSSISSINQESQSTADRASTGRNQPNIQQGHRQCQTRQPILMSQHCSFQIKTMLFHVAEHFLNPHSASVSPQSQLPVRQAGCQTPRSFFTAFPMDQQIHRIDLTFCQPSFSQPDAGTCFLSPTTKVLPRGLVSQTDMRSTRSKLKSIVGTSIATHKK